MQKKRIKPLKEKKLKSSKLKIRLAPEDSPLVEPPPTSETITFWTIFFKATALAILFALILLLITAAIVAGYLYKKVRAFSQASQTPISELKAMAQQGWVAEPVASQNHKNILLLGLDSLPNRTATPELTDTMMLISADLETGEVRTLPLPRDLWSSEYKTKINALYQYGKERNPEKPEQFPTEVLSQLTGVPIHHTLVLSIQTVSEIIEALDGLEVDVSEGFTDTQFPRSDVDIKTERDPAKLYETISFEPGKQVMSGETALKYMRSRHSEGDTGTDLARGKRQQQVLDALMAKLLNPETLQNPERAGKLFLLYKNTFGDVLPITELIATGKTLYPHRDDITQTSAVISVYPDEQTGVLETPPLKKYDQWVYEIRDIEKFKAEVQKDLGIPQ